MSSAFEAHIAGILVHIASGTDKGMIANHDMSSTHLLAHSRSRHDCMYADYVRHSRWYYVF